ncbi:cobyric acid synthase [Roseimaritima ulvae]|uniref:Cobyric acid synthase n=1 Tax=Roseimaritima ulvae TaxID=980254 RepID=A0A5B9QMH2_9BACT|nr:cobyric acid synthase [Roseimaritima ulvae]QEG38216.1 Cobyric acid synthase [Roseimaritima ulvae]
MTAKTVMVMGTSSSAGKSLLTTALCRCFARRGLRVAPFKAQNMSNNAAVCASGAEIGRSQALQAVAAGVPADSDMNPILLKPEGQTRSQVIVNGRPLQTLEANDYFQRRQQLWPHVTAALDRMRERYDVVVIEGAGSPAELNLAELEMVNMSVARYCQSPVLLIGDIERGGVFAQLLGTLWLLPPEDRRLVAGLIVNKFRGDLSLFDSGVEILQQRGGVPVLGVLPWIDALRLPEEDAVALDSPAASESNHAGDRLQIAVVRLPHIANFDDFDPLARTPGVHLRYVRSMEELNDSDVVILPGTKNTLGDLAWLQQSGLAKRIVQLAQRGTQIVGICGGYQMLGRRILNPDGLENGIPHADGLGLLPTETTFHPAKLTRQVQFELVDDSLAPGARGAILSGYEIHCGQTAPRLPWLCRHSNNDVADAQARDGSRSDDGRVWGCYLHGLFHNDAFRTAWLNHLGIGSITDQDLSADEQLHRSLDRLADAFEAHINMDQLMNLVLDSNPTPEPQHVA